MCYAELWGIYAKLFEMKLSK